MSTNNTLVGWTLESGGRGTWSVIWSSVATMVLAVWVSFHPNSLGVSTTRKYIKVAWTFFFLLIPEVQVVLAAADIAEAIGLQQILNGRDIKASLSQCFYMCMGAYVTAIPPDVPNVEPAQSFDEAPPRLKVLYPQQLLWLLAQGLLIWPDKDSHIQIELGGLHPRLLTSLEVKARSNAGQLAKAVVLLQSTWFIVQCILRGVHNLPLALVEILTLSYLVCSVASYAMWWHKPYDIQISSKLDLSLSLEQWAEIKQLNYEGKWQVDKGEEVVLETGWVAQFPRFAWLQCILFIGDGAVHLIAWNSSFPTVAEQLAWRVCTFILMIAPTVYVFTNPSYVGAFLSTKFKEKLWSTSNRARLYQKWRARLAWPALLFLVVVKSYLIIEAFASLRAASPNIYNTWVASNYFFGFF